MEEGGQNSEHRARCTAARNEGTTRGENNKDGTARDVCQVKLGGVRRIGAPKTVASSRLPSLPPRYPPRQPLNLWRCDNVDAAFCMLDYCRIHSRFSPTPSRRRLFASLARAFPNAYAGIGVLYQHRHRNHHYHRHCRHCRTCRCRNLLPAQASLAWLYCLCSGFRDSRQSTMSRARSYRGIVYSLPSSIIKLHGSQSVYMSSSSAKWRTPVPEGLPLT